MRCNPVSIACFWSGVSLSSLVTRSIRARIFLRISSILAFCSSVYDNPAKSSSTRCGALPGCAGAGGAAMLGGGSPAGGGALCAKIRPGVAERKRNPAATATPIGKPFFFICSWILIYTLKLILRDFPPRAIQESGTSHERCPWRRPRDLQLVAFYRCRKPNQDLAARDPGFRANAQKRDQSGYLCFDTPELGVSQTAPHRAWDSPPPFDNYLFGRDRSITETQRVFGQRENSSLHDKRYLKAIHRPIIAAVNLHWMICAIETAWRSFYLDLKEGLDVNPHAERAPFPLSGHLGQSFRLAQRKDRNLPPPVAQRASGFAARSVRRAKTPSSRLCRSHPGNDRQAQAGWPEFGAALL